METIVYKGENKPFMHVSNYGDVYLSEGDIITIRKSIDKYYIDVNGNLDKWRVLLQNAIPYTLYGFINDEQKIPFIKGMLNGKYKTSLEYNQESIETIKNNLPKENFKLIKWQSNYYYPVYNIHYINGMYLDITYQTNETKTPNKMAWHIYYNAMNLLPKECYNLSNDEMYTKSIKLY